MTHPDRLVVKAGGSLYEHPKLGDGLKAWLAARPEPHILIVPGGGDLVEAVRRLDTVHGLGEQASHCLAMMSLETAAFFMLVLLDDISSQPTRHREWWQHPSPAVVNPPSMSVNYERWYDVELPQTWEFTSDSLAACAAHDAGCELVLLKSIDIPPAMAWEDAAARGYVDAYFPTLVARHNLRVTAVNFRRVLDALPASGGATLV